MKEVTGKDKYQAANQNEYEAVYQRVSQIVELALNDLASEHGVALSKPTTETDAKIWKTSGKEMLFWAEKIIPLKGVRISKIDSGMTVEPKLRRGDSASAADGMTFGDKIAYMIQFQDTMPVQNGMRAKPSEVAKKLNAHDMECIVDGNAILVPENSWLKNVMEVFIQAQNSVDKAPTR